MAPKNDEVSTPKKGKSKMMILIIVGAVLLVGATGGATMYLIKDAVPLADSTGAGAEGQAPSAPRPSGPPIYFPITPAMVVNFENPGSARYLQVTLEVMSRNEDAIDAVRENLPAIRNGLLMLFGGQDADVLRTREGKESLRQEVLAEVQGVVEGQIGTKGVEDVYFTSLVMQ